MHNPCSSSKQHPVLHSATSSHFVGSAFSLQFKEFEGISWHIEPSLVSKQQFQFTPVVVNSAFA